MGHRLEGRLGVGLADLRLQIAADIGDGFSLVDPLEDKPVPSELLLEIAGYRHHPPPLTAHVIGKEVQLLAEPTNQHDPNAVQVMFDGRCVGYVNKVQAPSVKKWLEEFSVRAFIEKLNGRTDWPRAYIFLEVS